MKQINECIKEEKGHQIYRKEEGKQISFENINYEIVCGVVPIDNCVFNKVKGVRKCDYLFLFCNEKQEYQVLKNKNNLAYYVELKGIDLESACEQLFTSIDKTKDQLLDFEIFPLVVSSREFVPKYDNNEWNRNLKRLIKKEIKFEVTPCIINI